MRKNLGLLLFFILICGVNSSVLYAQNSVSVKKEENSKAASLQATPVDKICLSNGICIPANLAGGFPASELVKVCEIYVTQYHDLSSNIHRISPESLRDGTFCDGYFSGFVNAIIANGFVTKQITGESSLICLIEQHHEPWISRYIKFMKAHPELMSRNMDYTVYAMLLESQECKK